ncbi:MAG: GHKL domain-containing protein [bacterium]
MNVIGVWNTPGFFYAIGYSLATGVVLCHERSEGGARRKWASGVAAWLFMSGVLHATRDSEDLLYVVSMLAVVGTMFICFCVNTQDAVRSAFLAIKTFIYGEFSASLCWQVYYALALQHTGLREVAAMNGVMCAGFLAIGVVIWLIERSLRRGRAEVSFTWRDIAVEFLIGITVYVVSNLGYIDRASLFSGTNARDIFAIRTLVDMNGVGLIYLLQRQLIEVQTRFEKDALRSIMQMQYQAYQLSQESIDLVNQKYHDLKHQIALLRAQAGSESAKASLSRIEGDIRRYEAQTHTGSAVLDAVLTSKGLYCQNHDIEFKYIVDGKPLAMMDDMEIAALFGNMFDNAIESVERIADAERRLIWLYVTGERGFLRIRIENTCDEAVRFVDGLPLTNKRDRRYHGFGMKSMQRTVEKYGGSLMAEQQESRFCLKILIPMSRENADYAES